MRTSIRTVAVATTAVSLALLATACGGDKGTDSGKGSAAPSASATAAPAAEALSAAELEKLIVEQADLPGHQVQKAKATDVVKPETVSTDKASCKPLADAMSFIATGGPAASAQRKAIEVPKKTGSPEDALGALAAPVTGVTLGSYEGQGAQQAFASLKTAGTDCAGGFTITGEGEKAKVTEVAPETLSAGEEALAWTVTSDVDGEKFVTKLVAFRRGNTLASFSTISFGGEVKELPKAVIEAQAKKLG
ncbi:MULTISPECIES: hypothetical protein [unclassified Streptomyces]|uniref:hypothetical protein n=1 Tax=unclassified Streptomyces TaxID=2593676 RepID=UPI0006AE2F27|nr:MULTISPECIES: hypothetical protein [unclassified Streptomyces]KOX22851.1 lipoprotein [Streptomyces sp. NRRL F-6491]KOX40072.1 lipoprotein [Streptomyces sp. NRRL F-6492]